MAHNDPVVEFMAISVPEEAPGLLVTTLKEIIHVFKHKEYT